MSDQELASATIDLFQKGHLDVIAELLGLCPEDAAVGPLIKDAELREVAVDPGHWIWIKIVLCRLRDAENLPDLRDYVLSNLSNGNIDAARMLFEVQQSRGKFKWDSKWMSQIFASWRRAGVQV
jgi:hypothetical protein